jgi:tRNA modification GTPase
VRSGTGLHELSERVGYVLSGSTAWRDAPIVTNLRHVTLIESARDAVVRARQALDTSAGTLPEEFLLADLQDALDRLQEVTGRRTSEDLLRHIFARFCIGK